MSSAIGTEVSRRRFLQTTAAASTGMVAAVANGPAIASNKSPVESRSYFGVTMQDWLRLALEDVSNPRVADAIVAYGQPAIRTLIQSEVLAGKEMPSVGVTKQASLDNLVAIAAANNPTAIDELLFAADISDQEFHRRADVLMRYVKGSDERLSTFFQKKFRHAKHLAEQQLLCRWLNTLHCSLPFFEVKLFVDATIRQGWSSPPDHESVFGLIMNARGTDQQKFDLVRHWWRQPGTMSHVSEYEIGKLSDLGQQSASLLIEIALDSSSIFRPIAVRCLAEIGPSITSHIRELLCGDCRSRWILAHQVILAMVSASAPLLEFCVENLDDSDVRVRVTSAAALARHNQLSPEVESVLVNAIRNGSADLCREALSFWQTEGCAASVVAIDSLLPSLIHHCDVEVRLLALQRIAQLNLNTPEVVKTLERMWLSPNCDHWEQDFAVFQLLSKKGFDGVRIACKGLDSPCSKVQRASTQLLDEHGKDAECAVEQLGIHWREGAPENRTMILNALLLISPDDRLVPFIHDAIDLVNEVSGITAQGFACIQRLSAERAVEFLPVIRRFIGSDSRDLQRAAASALQACGNEGLEVVAELLDSACPYQRVGATLALGYFPNLTSQVMEMLHGAANDPDLAVELAARESAKRIRKDG
jgi:HEAT repeat protein